MKNAFLRAGHTCVSMMLAGGLMTVGLFGAQATPVVVTLPHTVTVGNTLLPKGEYTISSLDLANGDSFFVVRSSHGATVTLQAQKVAVNEETPSTEVVFSRDGDTWRFDRMAIQGQDGSYEFINPTK